MLSDFLTTRVRIDRKSDEIFSGSLAASLTFTQLSQEVFLSFDVSGINSAVTFTLDGVWDGASYSESIVVSTSNLKGNRGFQSFDSLTAITCSGDLDGTAIIKMLGEDADPIFITSIVGTFWSDKSLKPETQSLEVFGREDEVPKNFKYCFQGGEDIQENDTLIHGADRFRIKSVTSVDSLTGVVSHIEATVTEFGE